MVEAELLSIGSELLLGETVDTNAAFLARELATLGMPLRHARMVPDDRAVIREAFAEARARSAVVLATGGLGPTHDDLTREGLADALGETLAEDPELVAVIEERFRAFGPMPAANRRQGQLIPSAETVPNPIGSAPGWWVERDGSVVALMPGVPSEMRLMWTDRLRPRLAQRFGLPPLAMRTVKSFGIGESALAERLGTLLEAPPAGVEAGIYARDDGVHVRFSTAGDPGGLDPLVSATREALGEHAYGIDEEDLASAALARLGALGAATLGQLGGGHRGRAAGDPLRHAGSGGCGPLRGRHPRCGRGFRAAGRRRHDPAVAAAPGRAWPQPGPGRGHRCGLLPDDGAAHPRLRTAAAAPSRIRRARRGSAPLAPAPDQPDGCRAAARIANREPSR